MMKFLVVCAVGLWVFTSPSVAQTRGTRALPHVIIYKTRADYNNKVPVSLTTDRTSIANYPAPADLKTGSAFALPVLLHKGYLLDKRGVDANSVFTGYTYKEYAALNEVPSPEELMKSVKDKDPLVALYDCGTDRKTVAELNKIIDRNQLRKKCKSLK